MLTGMTTLPAPVAIACEDRATRWMAVGEDELTGLVNRRLFATIAPALLSEDRPAVVVVLDLDGVRAIADTFGERAGDEVLRVVARRLAACAGDDLVGRLGGDTFAGVLTHPVRCRPGPVRSSPGPTGRDQAYGWWQSAVARMWAATAEPVRVMGRTVSVTASIGVAPAEDGVVITELLRRAGTALCHAKASGEWYAAWDPDAPAPGGGADPRTIEFALFPATPRAGHRGVAA
jgi:GGDEF domain-containing protein